MLIVGIELRVEQCAVVLLVKELHAAEKFEIGNEMINHFCIFLAVFIKFPGLMCFLLAYCFCVGD